MGGSKHFKKKLDDLVQTCVCLFLRCSTPRPSFPVSGFPRTESEGVCLTCARLARPDVHSAPFELACSSGHGAPSKNHHRRWATANNKNSFDTLFFAPICETFMIQLYWPTPISSVMLPYSRVPATVCATCRCAVVLTHFCQTPMNVCNLQGATTSQTPVFSHDEGGRAVNLRKKKTTQRPSVCNECFVSRSALIVEDRTAFIKGGERCRTQYDLTSAMLVFPSASIQHPACLPDGTPPPGGSAPHQLHTGAEPDCVASRLDCTRPVSTRS